MGVARKGIALAGGLRNPALFRHAVGLEAAPAGLRQADGVLSSHGLLVPGPRRRVRCDDAELAIAWPSGKATSVVSANDAAAAPLGNASVFDRLEMVK